MRKPHFFKAISRLGLINNPYRTNDLNIGVEEAPDYLLTPDFLENFSPALTDSFIFPKPEATDKKQYAKIMADYSRFFADLINSRIKSDETQVVIGGDHSITLSTITALLNRVDPKEVGYVQFDSHGDINTFATSPTGNFHGIYLRALIEDIDSVEINEVAGKKLKVENMLYIGNLDLDPEEKDFVAKNKVRIINRDEILADSSKIKAELQSFIAKFSHLHVSFDVDMFDKSVLTATGIPCDKGLFPADIDPLLDLIANQAKNLSVDLVEINPKKVGGKEAIKLGQEILLQLLKQLGEF